MTVWCSYISELDITELLIYNTVMKNLLKMYENYILEGNLEMRCCLMILVELKLPQKNNLRLSSNGTEIMPGSAVSRNQNIYKCGICCHPYIPNLSL